MESIAKTAYETCVIGSYGSIRPHNGSREALEQFQQEVQIAQQLEQSSKIRIHKSHLESQTGHDYVDLIVFERIE